MQSPTAGPSEALTALLEQIDALQMQIDALRPLPPDREARILQRFRIDWNYHSNNLEGNSYNYGETKAFLLHGITAGGKPLRDSLEIRGHNKAIFALEDLVHGDEPLTAHTIRELHSIILAGESYEVQAETSDGVRTSRTVVPGRYKTEPNHVRTATGETFFFTEPIAVEAEMRELLEWYGKIRESKEFHPIVTASTFHYRFVRIHPFDDGNGRMARILMNLILIQHGLPVAIVRTEDKAAYYNALQQADGENLDAFVRYIAKQEIASQQLWLRGAHGDFIANQS